MYSFEGERVRFCSQCNLNVYNLSAMTRDEAKALLYKTEGRLCVRFYRRSDGTVLTQNCPVGLRALKRRAAWAAQVLLGMLLTLLVGAGLSGFNLVRRLEDMLAPRHSVMGGLAGPVEAETAASTLPETEVEMGKAVRPKSLKSRNRRDSK
jgi:hypothetical protein